MRRRKIRFPLRHERWTTLKQLGAIVRPFRFSFDRMSERPLDDFTLRMG